MSLQEAQGLQERREYIDEMSEAGKQAGSGSPGNIAQVKVEFGWHRFIEDKDFWTSFVPVLTPDKADVGREACSTILRKYNSTETPNFGVRTYVFGKTVLPTPWKNDGGEFIAKWQEDAYTMLLEKLIQVEGFTFNKTLWARVKSIPNPYFVKKGESGKTKLRKDKSGEVVKDSKGNDIYDFPTIRVISEVFPNKIAAKKAADESSTSTSDTPELSAKAKEHHVKVEHIQGQSEQIVEWRKAGMSEEYIANEMEVEVSDLRFAEEVPF